MSLTRKWRLTLAGQTITGVFSAIGETVDYELILVDQETLLPLDLIALGCAVVMGLCELDYRGNPIQPPIIARQADTLGHDGSCHIPWANGDTVLTPPITPGNKGLDVWITDGDGNRLQAWPVVGFTLRPAGILPSTLVTPLPAQAPLAQGPPGPFPSAPNSGTFRAVQFNGAIRAQQEEMISIPFDGSTAQVDVVLATYGISFGVRPWHVASVVTITDDAEMDPIQCLTTPRVPGAVSLQAPNNFVGTAILTLREVLS